MVMTTMTQTTNSDTSFADNSVPAGYKRTEVGVIPEDWLLRPLLSAVRIVKGQVDPKVEPYRSMVLVAPDHIERGTGRLLQKQTAEEQRAISGKYLFSAGDIVYSKIRPYLMKAILTDFDGLCSADMYPMKPAPDVSAGFIFAILLGRHFTQYAESVSMRSGIPKINRVELADYKVALPPTFAEQQLIAEALGDADRYIESLEQLITKKRQVKQGAMQDLLTGKRRLPGFSGEWDEKSFGSIFDFLPTATNSRSDLKEEGDVYYVHYGDIHTKFHSHLDFSTSRLPKIARAKCRNAAILRNGDWLMVDASEDYDGVGKAVEVIGLSQEVHAISGLHTFLLREKGNTYVPGFKGHLGNLASLHDQYLRVMTGMKVFGVSKTALREVTLPVPSPEEQSAIVHTLSDMDTELIELEAKLAKARQLKQGMTQELLTGKVRLV